MSDARRSLLDQPDRRATRLFRIVRTDGELFLFTDANATVTFRGESYLPAGGVAATSASSGVGLSDRDQDFRGVLSNDAITEDDLRAGLYRGAKVFEWRVDFEAPDAVPMLSARYTITNTTWTDRGWTAETIGLTRPLTQEVGRKWGRGCWWRLGEGFGQAGVAGCKVDVQSLKSAGVAVSSVTSRAVFVVANTLSGSPGNDYFADGEIRWLTGANAGTISVCARFVAASRTFYLAIPPAHPVAVSDTADFLPGCDKTLATCSSKFSNTKNYGGSPFIQGQDQASRGIGS